MSKQVMSHGVPGGLIAAAARCWLHTPYHHQAAQRDLGTDCLGLLRGIWREFQSNEPTQVPPYTSSWRERGGKDRLLVAAQRYLVEIDDACTGPGDVLLFRFTAQAVAKHVGISLGRDRFIHAHESAGVCLTDWTNWWAQRRIATFRFPFNAAVTHSWLR